MPTPARGLPYPGSDGSNNVPFDLQALAEAIDGDLAALLGTGAATTAWAQTGIVWSSGVSAGAAVVNWEPVAYRRIGRRVEISGTVVRTTSGGAGTALFTMPTGFRPARQAQSNTIRVQPNGLVVSTAALTAATDYAVSIDYTLDFA